MRGRDTTWDDIILDGYNNGDKFVEIAAKIPRGEDFVRDVLKRLGVYKQKRFVRTFNFKESFGDNFPSTKEDWYLIGLLLADGSVYRKGGVHKVCLELEEKDLTSLENIRDRYFPKGNIIKRSTRNLYSLSWQSAELCDLLAKYGIQQNKMRKTCPPLDEILFKDYSLAMSFLGGHFDGDGCVSLHHTNGLRFNITANTGVADKLELLLRHWGFQFNRWNNVKETFGSFNFRMHVDNFRNFYNMINVCSLNYSRRKEHMAHCVKKHLLSFKMVESQLSRVNEMKKAGAIDWIPLELL